VEAGRKDCREWKGTLPVTGMAFLEVKYVKKGRGEREAVKANIRYIQNRRGRDGAKIQRTLFGSGGNVERADVYRMIDEAERGSTFFKVIINFDRQTEDTRRDLSHREIVEQVMHALEDQLQTSFPWVAVLHDDHTALRHIHAMVIVRERLLPVQAMKQAAIEAISTQRRERDLLLEKSQVRENQAEVLRKEDEDRAWQRERSK
jgi:hypothetical protein